MPNAGELHGDLICPTKMYVHGEIRGAPVNTEQVAKLLTSSGSCLLFLRSAEDKQRPRCEEQPSPSSPAGWKHIILMLRSTNTLMAGPMTCFWDWACFYGLHAFSRLILWSRGMLLCLNWSWLSVRWPWRRYDHFWSPTPRLAPR